MLVLMFSFVNANHVRGFPHILEPINCALSEWHNADFEMDGG